LDQKSEYEKRIGRTCALSFKKGFFKMAHIQMKKRESVLYPTRGLEKGSKEPGFIIFSHLGIIRVA
jgi:hypothetical protein